MPLRRVRLPWLRVVALWRTMHLAVVQRRSNARESCWSLRWNNGRPRELPLHSLQRHRKDIAVTRLWLRRRWRRWVIFLC